MEDIKETITQMADKFNEELYSKKQEELEQYWHFDFEKVANKDYALSYYDYYNFFKALEMYSSFCRRWEQHHNGFVCVVERVRDTYLIPKIKKYHSLMIKKYLQEFTKENKMESNSK